MSEREIPPLPPEAEDLLAAERDRPGFDAGTLARIKARVDASLAQAPATRPVNGRGTRLWYAVTFVGGLILGAVLHAALSGSAHLPVASPPVPTTASAPAPSSPSPLPVPPAVPPAPVIVPRSPTADASPRTSPTSRRIRPAARAAPGSGAPPAEADERDLDLAAERALLDTARTALGRAQGLAALDVLHLHGAQFPSGRLVEEREALVIHALVQLRRYEEARQAAARFRRQRPASMLLPVVDAALGSIP